MPDRRWWPLPVSAPTGDVIQAINPLSWLIRNNAQTGLVNITTGRTDDPLLEHRIVADVASYGRQLGRVIDVLCVVVAELPRADLSPGQRAVVDKFTELAEDIAEVKTEARAARFTEPEIDRLIADIKELRSSDEPLYRRLTVRLQAAFPPERKPREPRARGSRVSAG
jgi:hypothetical protein